MINSSLEPRIFTIRVKPFSFLLLIHSFVLHMILGLYDELCWIVSITLVIELLAEISVKSSFERSVLPRPEDFSKALYTFDIGQNDLSVAFRTMNDEQLLATIPNIISQFSSAVQVRFFYLGLLCNFLYVM